MSGTASISPIERFLGPDAARGGPFALLGLSPANCADGQILGQLQRQLDLVNGHLQAETPQADEVRLALHAAAAQLLDPVVRRHLMQRWAGQEVRAPQRAEREVVPTASARVLSLEHDAILVLARHGGWNAQALKRLAIIAHARGIPEHEVPGAIRAILHRRRSGGGRPAAGVPTGMAGPSVTEVPAPTRWAGSGGNGAAAGGSAVVAGPTPAAGRVNAAPTGASAGAVVAMPAATPAARAVQAEIDDDDAPSGNLGPALFVIGIFVAMLGAAAVMLVVLPRMQQGGSTAEVVQEEAPPPVVTDAGKPEAPAGEKPPPEQAPRNEPPPLLVDGPAIRQLFANATEGLGVEPGASLRQFQRAVESLAACWADLPPDQVAACSDAIVEYLYRSASWPSVNLAAAEAVAMPSRRLRLGARGLDVDEVWPSAWSVGMLTRLARERELPVGVGAVVDAGLSEALGGGRTAATQSFESGLITALGIQPRFMTSNQVTATDTGAERLAEVWQKWLAGVNRATVGDAALRTRMLLAGLELLAREGPEPNQHKPTFEAMGMIAGAIDWDDGSAAQPWLVRSLASAAWSVADLFVVTSAIVRAGAPGVDLSMVVPIRATDLQRQELRERYRVVWGLDVEQGGRELVTRWRESVQTATGRAAGDVTAAEFLASATRMARLNVAAERHWLGDYNGCADLLDHLDDPIDAALATTPPAGYWTLDDSGPNAWWVRYRAAAQNVQRRRELLDELGLSSGRAIGRIEAEILVYEAVRGTPDVIRQRAHEIVPMFSDQATIVNAMLEVLPETPATRRNVELLAVGALIRTPSTDDPLWRLRIRRGLVERLLQLLAAESDLAVIDRLGELMADAYHARLSLAPDSGMSVEVPPAEFSAGAMRVSWLRRGESVLANPSLQLALGAIERRRVARMAMVDGPVQRFVAEQMATAELMGYVIAAERPGAAAQVSAILEEMAVRRRSANHVLEQVRAGEWAMMELWSVRLGEVGP